MQRKSVGIIGCGWLGQALAKSLISKSYEVIATVRSAKKRDQLINEGINTELLSLPVTSCSSTCNVFAQTVLILLITPQIRQGRADYSEKIAQCVALANKGKVKQIILINSTAIYNGLAGDVDENSQIDTNADKVSILDNAEQQLQQFQGDYITLRLAGLVSEDRHPGKFLKAGRPLTQGHVPVNLIHQVDVIGLIEKILTMPSHSAIYNGVSATLASKQAYYQAAADALGLPAPNFAIEDVAKNATGKKIKGDKTKLALSYSYVYDDLLQWLTANSG